MARAVREDVKAVLNRSILKEHLSPAQIDSFARHLKVHPFSTGERIVSAGAPAVNMMFLVKGEARVVVGDLQVELLPPGSILGESMFSAQGTRTADVFGKTEGVLAELTLEDHEKLVRSDPQLALKCKRVFESLYLERQNENRNRFGLDTTRYLALIAHNEMKQSLVDFVERHRDTIEKFPLVATGTTGALLHKKVGVMLSRKVKSGPLGGDQAVGSLISEGNVRGVIFFRDPLSAHPHHADIEALGRLCDVYQIPFATNPTTAVAILKLLEDDDAQAADNAALQKYQAQQQRVVEGT